MFLLKRLALLSGLCPICEVVVQMAMETTSFHKAT